MAKVARSVVSVTMGAMKTEETESTWRDRKQQMARDAIYDAAIELFAAKGFEETTADEIAEAAGVSRRTFFRYFASKDDLLAQSVVSYGEVLAEQVRSAPANVGQRELLERALLAGVEYTSKDLGKMRQLISVVERSMSARQAHQSRMMQVEDTLTEAFASRKGTKRELRARLMAGITLAVMQSTLLAWYRGEDKDLPGAAKRVMRLLGECLGG